MRNFRSLGLVSLFLTVVAVPLSAFAASGPTLKEVRLSGQQSKAQVEIVADSPLTYTYYRMPDLQKVAIDLALVDPGQVSPIIAGAGLISKITVEKKDITTFSLTRLLIDLHEDADFTVHPDAADRSRLLVTFTAKETEPVAKKVDELKEDREKPIAPPGATVTELPPPTAPVEAASATPIPAAPATGIDPAPVKEEPTTSPPTTRVLAPVIPAVPASRSIDEIRVSKNAVEIKATSRLDDYKAFTLIKPARLVIDVPMSKTPLAAKEISVKRFGITKARIGNYPDKVRMVFDTEGSTFPPYRIVRNDKGLAIVFAPRAGK